MVNKRTKMVAEKNVGNNYVSHLIHSRAVIEQPVRFFETIFVSVFSYVVAAVPVPSVKAHVLFITMTNDHT